MQTDCAWTASASYKTANLFFPDAESIYHIMYFSDFGPADMAMYVGSDRIQREEGGSARQVQTSQTLEEHHALVPSPPPHTH